MVQSVEIKAEPTGMIAPEEVKAPEVQGERPAWLNTKFKSPEELSKAYDALEKKLGAPKVDEAAPADEAGKQPAEEAAAAVDKAGLDFDALSQHFAEHGELSEDHYKALAEKSGVPRSLVDSFIAGQQAIAAQAQESVFQSVGGQEQYGAMVEWAKASLTPAQITAYNTATSSNDMAQIMLAVSGLKSQYEGANGKVGTLISGRTTSSESAFRSWSEVKAAMNDPRYDNDPAYRADVESRVSRSKVL